MPPAWDKRTLPNVFFPIVPAVGIAPALAWVKRGVAVEAKAGGGDGLFVPGLVAEVGGEDEFV